MHSNDEEEFLLLKKLMDDYGNHEHHKQTLLAEKTKMINSLLSPEQQAEIESIELELSSKEETLKKNEEYARKNLDLAISEYVQKLQNSGQGSRRINSELMTLSIGDEDVVEWDTRGLDSLIAEGHTELLKYRKVKKLRTRLTKRKL